MEEKSKSSSIYALNVGGLLLVLSIIGSTPRFVVISVTLVSWLQTQWLAYTSALKKRHSERLAAAADEDRTRRRKQVADITEEIGGNVISLLDKRRQELVLRLDEEAERKRRSYQQDIVTKITGHLADFQESERVKDEQRLKIREDEILQRERELKAKEQALQKLREELDGRKKELEDSERALEEQQEDLEEREKEAEDRERDLQAQQEDLEEREQELEDSERYLHTRQKKVEERERKAKAAEADLQKLHQKQEELKIQRRVANQRTTTVATPNPLFSPDPPSLASNSITLPSELLQYAKDLNSYYFTCIGVTKKGTRCGQSMISNADKSAASRRIAKMASPDAGDGTDLYEMQALRELADWMLCPRWHRDKLPQGAEIARRWYGELRDARAANTRPVSSWKTPSSAGAASIFSSTGTGNYSTGTTASSFGSSMQSVSMSYTSSDYQFTSPDNAASGPPGFGHPVARHLTPVFEFMAEQSAVTKKGFGQWD